MLTHVWKEKLKNYFLNHQFDLSEAAIGVMFRSDEMRAIDVIENWDEFTIKRALTKASAYALRDFLEHVFVPFEYKHPEQFSLRQLLSYNKDTGVVDNNILSFMSDIDQVFPVYTSVPEHTEMVSEFFKNKFLSILYLEYSDRIYSRRRHIENKEYYLNGGILWDFVKHDRTALLPFIKNTSLRKPINEVIHDKDHNFHIVVLYNTSYSTTFLLGARRLVLKDFDLLSNCFCTPISEKNELKLNRRNTPVNVIGHMITVFDIGHVNYSNRYSLLETETVQILDIVKHYKISKDDNLL